MTDYLFARPSFLSGVGSIADLAGKGPVYNSWPTAAEADAWALYSDWLAVGEDLWGAIDIGAAETGSGV